MPHYLVCLQKMKFLHATIVLFGLVTPVVALSSMFNIAQGNGFDTLVTALEITILTSSWIVVTPHVQYTLLLHQQIMHLWLIQRHSSPNLLLTKSIGNISSNCCATTISTDTSIVTLL